MKITGKTKVIGIIGWPVSHSLSPVMHNAAFEFLGLDYCYVPFAIKPENLKEAVEAVTALNIAGLNVTVPHKENVLKYVYELSEEAGMIGAVNTLKVTDKGLAGYNTDGTGFINAIKEAGNPVTNKRLLILGSGGSAKAVVFKSASEGVEGIIIANRTVSKAIALMKQVKEYFPLLNIEVTGTGYDELKGAIEKVDTVVNTTSVGLRKEDSSPVPGELIHKGLFIYDLIYNPYETTFLRYAKAAGCRYSNGLGMLIHQGAESFRIWTGVEPPVEVMRQAVERAMSKL
ncbi:MAG: shikimate dehydrogenase [Nitrospirae bacterium]|nr:shikimate dehydrogenase [Nitrospirota bacterium]